MGALVEGQSLTSIKSIRRLGVPRAVSCFREYSDKKNTNENLKSLAVEHAIQSIQ